MARETDTIPLTPSRPVSERLAERLTSPPPKIPRSAHLTVRLEPGDKDLIKACASESGLTVSEWVRRAAVGVAEEQWSKAARRICETGIALLDELEGEAYP